MHLRVSGSLAQTQQKAVAVVTAIQRFGYLAAYFVGFL